MPAQSELDLPHVISIREWMSASQCDEKKILSTLFPLQRGPGRSFHWSVCHDVREEAGRVGLIDVVCSGSLLRDRDRQLRGVWMSNRDDRRTTAKSHAPSTGKSLLVIISETWMLGIHSSTGTINGRQRHLAVCVFEVQQWSLTEEGEVRPLCLSEQAPLRHVTARCGRLLWTRTRPFLPPLLLPIVTRNTWDGL